MTTHATLKLFVYTYNWPTLWKLYTVQQTDFSKFRSKSFLGVLSWNYQRFYFWWFAVIFFSEFLKDIHIYFYGFTPKVPSEILPGLLPGFYRGIFPKCFKNFSLYLFRSSSKKHAVSSGISDGGFPGWFFESFFWDFAGIAFFLG